MNIASQLKLNEQLKNQRSILVYSTVCLLLSNTLLSVYLITQDKQIVLVPTHINKELTISQFNITEEYLEVIVRDIAMQLLNLTPDTYEYVESQILKLALPSNYGHLKAELKVLGDDVRSRNISVAFQIQEIAVDAKTLECEVVGYLETRMGTMTVAREKKTYRFDFAFENSRLGLKEFHEVRQENEVN